MAKHYQNERLLQIANILFETLKTNSEIASEMAEYGYDEPQINEGKALYERATAQQQANKKETKEAILAYEAFEKLFDAFLIRYKSDRKRAKIVFKDEPCILKILALEGIAATRIMSIVADTKTFYNELNNDEGFQKAVLRVKITEEHIKNQLDALEKIEKAYAAYNKEKGESQQATKDQEVAFAQLEKWIRKFYSYAKIALEDRPQLLESIAKFVRS